MITPTGTLTTLHSFDCATEGCGPVAGVVQGGDANFYGTTPFAGPGDVGGVFRILAKGLTGLSPASMWLGLKNGDDVGLRLDLRADVFVNSTHAGGGQLDDISSGSSGFSNALIYTIPLALTGEPVNFPNGSTSR